MILDINFTQLKSTLAVDFGQITRVTETDLPQYQGPYKVTPSTEPQVLYTAKQLMNENVHIESIPFYDVSNNAGGKTVYIGKEIITT